jgi:thioredoxin 1
LPTPKRCYLKNRRKKIGGTMAGVLELNKENFEKETSSGVALVDFWAPWCGPCRIIGPVVEEIAAEMDKIKVGKVNIDDNQDLAVQFSVMSIPTLIIFKDGKPMSSSVGVVSKKALIDKIEAVL